MTKVANEGIQYSPKSKFVVRFFTLEPSISEFNKICNEFFPNAVHVSCHKALLTGKTCYQYETSSFKEALIGFNMVKTLNHILSADLHILNYDTYTLMAQDIKHTIIPIEPFTFANHGEDAL